MTDTATTLPAGAVTGGVRVLLRAECECGGRELERMLPIKEVDEILRSVSTVSKPAWPIGKVEFAGNPARVDTATRGERQSAECAADWREMR